MGKDPDAGRDWGQEEKGTPEDEMAALKGETVPGFDPWVGKNPWRRKWQPTPMFLPGEYQGRGSLVGCHLWGRTESDMTEVISKSCPTISDPIFFFFLKSHGWRSLVGCSPWGR